MFSANPTPKKLYGLISNGAAQYGIRLGVNGFITNLSILLFDTHMLTCNVSTSLKSLGISNPASSAIVLSMLPQNSSTSNLFTSY